MTATITPCPDPATDDTLTAIRATIDTGLARHKADEAEEAGLVAEIDAGLLALLRLAAEPRHAQGLPS